MNKKDQFSHEDLIPALKNMEVRGGGFYSALAKAWLRADMVNSKKLYKEFSHAMEVFAPVSNRN